MGGGGGSETTTNIPWTGQQPYLQDLFSQASGLFDSGIGQNFYPGQTVADLSQPQQQGMDMLINRGLSGSPQQNAMGNYLTQAMGQQQIDPMLMAQGGYGAMQGIGQGQQMMQQAGQPLSQQQAQGFAGDVNMGNMGNAQAFANRAMGNVSPDFAGTAQQMQGLLGQQDFGGIAQQMQNALGQGNFANTAQQVQGQMGNTLDPAAAAQLRGTAGGDYLGSNPYLDQMFNSAAQGVNEQFSESVMPALNATFGQGGRTGSGIQALLSGKLAGESKRALGDLASNIYGPAYESERGRQVDAAGQLGQLGIGSGQLGLGGLQVASDIYGKDLGQSLGGLNAATDIYGQNIGQQLGGLNAATNVYGRDLNQQLGAAQLGGDLFSGLNQAELGRNTLGADMYNAGQNRQLQAGQGLGNLGLGGLDAMNNTFSNIGDQGFRAATQASGFRDMEYGDIEQLMRVGGMTQDQAQQYINSERERFDFYQNAPQNALSNYASTVYGLPGGYGTQTSSGGGGSQLAGAAGGALAGYQLGGPWGAAAGGLLGFL